jgi:hypothetical protein
VPHQNEDEALCTLSTVHCENCSVLDKQDAPFPHLLLDNLFTRRVQGRFYRVIVCVFGLQLKLVAHCVYRDHLQSHPGHLPLLKHTASYLLDCSVLWVGEDFGEL